MEGQILTVDKPLEWTSFQAVNKIKWAIRKKYGLKKIKVGHAGTLDPLATGLLLVCTGRATKKISQLQQMPKTYTGTIRLGATTPSYDLETEVDATYPTSGIDEAAIRKAAAGFLGKIQQQPPLFSAIRKDGKRLYEYARQGKTVKIESREVVIHEFDIVSVNMPDIAFSISCSKGTYIRSIAHELGLSLGSGAHLTSLRRTKIGDYNVNNGLSPEDFAAALEKEP